MELLSAMIDAAGQYGAAQQLLNAEAIMAHTAGTMYYLRAWSCWDIELLGTIQSCNRAGIVLRDLGW